MNCQRGRISFRLSTEQEIMECDRIPIKYNFSNLVSFWFLSCLLHFNNNNNNNIRVGLIIILIILLIVTKSIVII